MGLTRDRLVEETARRVDLSFAISKIALSHLYITVILTTHIPVDTHKKANCATSPSFALQSDKMATLAQWAPYRFFFFQQQRKRYLA